MHGRDLLLPRTTLLAPPPVPPAFMVLVMRYRPDCVYRAQPDLRSLCPGALIAPQNEQPEFVWKTVDAVEPGREVPLTGAWVDSGQLASALFSEVRRRARSEAHPKLGAGETQAGQTGWRVVGLLETPVVWLQTAVDTSEAGFPFTPCYFAQLTRADGSAFPSGPPQLFIQDARPDGFTARILIARDLPLATQFTAEQAEAAGWTASWLAVEAA
jgi:hypothetical protein